MSGGLIVVNHHNALPLNIFRDNNHMIFAVRPFFKNRGKPEPGALAFPAVHADPAVHHLGKSLGNGQSQSGAAIFACCRAVRLRERFK
jgi:hypothetical protein